MATGWLFTSLAEDFELGRPRKNPTSGQRVNRTGTAGLRVRRADHSATKRAERRGLMKMIKILNDRPFTEY